MRIPTSRGRVDPQAQMQTFTPNTGLAELGQSIGGALQGKQAKEDEAAVQANKTQLILNEQQKKIDTANYVQQSSKFSADIDLIDSDITARMQSGALDVDAAVLERQNALDKIKQQYMPEVPNTRKADFDQYIEKTSYQSASKYMPIAEQAARSQASTQLNQVSENLLKSSTSLEDGEKSIREFGIAKNLPIGTVEAAVNKYKNNSSTNEANSWFTGIMDNNDQLSKMTTPEEVLKVFPNLTQEQAIEWAKKSLSRITQNNKAAETERKELVSLGKNSLSSYQESIVSGIPATDELKSQWRNSIINSGDQELIKQYKNYSNNEVEARTFATMPPDARLTYLTKQQTQLQNNPQADPKAAEIRLRLLQETHNKMLGYEKNNAPMAYAIATGREIQVVPTTLLAQGDQSAIEALKKNVITISTARQERGATGSSNPLAQQQISEMKQYLQNANSAQKLELGTSLFKASAGNANAARDMINSVFGDKNSIRWAISLNSRNLSTIANQVVSGQDLLDKNLVKLNDSGLEYQVTEYLKGITSPGTPEYKIYFDSVKANYAYLAQKSEKLTDKSGKLDAKNIDPDLFKKSILEVTGGKFSTGGWGGGNVVLRPHTVGEKSFSEQLERFNSQNSKVYGGSDKDFFLDLPLEQDPKNPYRYYFKNGSGYILDKSSNKDPKKQDRLALVLH
ncbi:hypothetical protein [Acinetobacter sp. IK40]|uniref:hypothetical protein n=1 Tax=Acinetobacter sp. IK40 TaxID=2928897 RepID=UPI002D1E906E|nr:hypothetical protein [Acinetobacter sp. IK40]MEB3790140.1 hypothetical protein [Acinetobacter sp. IK40]